MLADAYFPLRYLIAVRLLHMKRKILPEFSISTPLYYMENWSLDDFLLQLVNEHNIPCCIQYIQLWMHVSYFFE